MVLVRVNKLLYGLAVTTDDDVPGVWEINFRERMIRLREDHGMTQTDLARALRHDYGLPFHQQTVERIESGKRPIRLNEAHLVAQIFDVDLSTMTADTESANVSLQLVKRRLAETTVYLDDSAEEMGQLFMNLQKAWAAYSSAQGERGSSVEKLIDKGLSHTLRRFETAFEDGRDVLESVIQIDEA